MLDRFRESDNEDGDLDENFNVREFIFTNKTITYGGRTVQLCNVTRIWLYDLTETNKAQFRFTWKQTILSITISIISFWFSTGFNSTPILFLIGLTSFAIAAYGLYERVSKRDKVRNFFGLVIETASSKENLITSNREFVHQLFRDITKAMNLQETRAIVANFVTGAINHIDNMNVHNGDVFENIADSTIVNRFNT